ncbi:MAG TPA: OmpA family protein [Gemmatimonadaceae bacterium]|nr:OmpA family protein [Gemmatimonadaceae bacterium]
MSRTVIRAFTLIALALGSAHTASAQGFLHKLKQKVKEKAGAAVDTGTNAMLDSVASKAKTVVHCLISDNVCMQRAAAAGQAVAVTDADGNAVSSADSAAAMDAATRQVSMQSGHAVGTDGSAGGDGAAESQPPGVGVWLNYDFVPGDRVLFYDDFGDDRVGDLPTHEDVTDGNVTIVEIDGKKYFRTVTSAIFWINLPEVLPQRFTIEATFHGPNANPLTFTVGDDGDKSMQVWCYQNSAGVSGSGPNGDKNSHQDATGISDNDLVHCRFMFDGGYVKSYINEQRLGQLNGLIFSRTKKIKVEVPRVSEEDGGALVTEIRIAEGGKPLYDALAASGRVSTHGILFATGSATIEGESTPTLKEIGEMLKAHPELKLTIEGHTDNVGDAAANQTLSEQRAAAVARYLETSYQIDASRLATRGYGATKPVASNDTPEGRQQNRRVELVKM